MRGVRKREYWYSLGSKDVASCGTGMVVLSFRLAFTTSNASLIGTCVKEKKECPLLVWTVVFG